MESFEKARAGLSAPELLTTEGHKREEYPIPPLKLDHLLKMSDHTGIFQHAIYNVPNYHEAYCTDDNARAFIFTVLMQEGELMREDGEEYRELKRLGGTYLALSLIHI